MIAITQALAEIKKPGIQIYAIINVATIILTWFSKNMLVLYQYLYDADLDEIENYKLPKRRQLFI